MALGLNYAASEGGDITPIVKYDARAGKFFRIDRENNESVPYDISNQFAAVFDLENIEVGWAHFMPGQAPDFQMVPIGNALPARPSPKHKQGFRMKIKLAGPAGGDVREFGSNAKCVLAAIDVLHDAYKAGLAEHPGQLPVVRMNGTLVIKTNGPMGPSTNYQPVFEIIRWAPRPQDLGAPSPAASLPAAAKAGAPSTGATKMAPPAASSVPFDVDEDFG